MLFRGLEFCGVEMITANHHGGNLDEILLQCECRYNIYLKMLHPVVSMKNDLLLLDRCVSMCKCQSLFRCVLMDLTRLYCIYKDLVCC